VVLAGFLARERLQSLESRKQQVDTNNNDDDVIVKDSLYGPYLDTLPWERGINNQEHTLYWSDEQAETMLPGTMCFYEIMALREEVSVAIRVMNGVIGSTVREWRNEIKPKSFQWPWEALAAAAEAPDPKILVQGLPEVVKGAFVSLLTRSFLEEDHDNYEEEDYDDDDDMSDTKEKLVPLLDILQHSEDPNICHSMNKDTGAVQVTARRPLQAGEELWNQYRSELEESMPYHRFFTRYGFVPGITDETMEQLLKEKSSIFFAQKREV
jgi:hypothetical protein